MNGSSSNSLESSLESLELLESLESSLDDSAKLPENSESNFYDFFAARRGRVIANFVSSAGS